MPPRTAASPSKTKRAAPKPRAAKAAVPAKTPAASKAPAKPPSPAKARANKARPGKAGIVSPGDRCRLISHAAYLRAERRGFAPGNELADWLEAEAEVDALLSSRGEG